MRPYIGKSFVNMKNAIQVYYYLWTSKMENSEQ